MDIWKSNKEKGETYVINLNNSFLTIKAFYLENNELKRDEEGRPIEKLRLTFRLNLEDLLKLKFAVQEEIRNKITKIQEETKNKPNPLSIEENIEIEKPFGEENETL
jgi:hypothetical protein